MNEIKTIASFVSDLGPTALLAIGLYFLAKGYREKDGELKQERADRLKDAKDTTVAMLAVAEKVNQMIDKLETLFESRK